MKKITTPGGYLERNCLICLENHFKVLNVYQQEVLVRNGLFKFEITEGICRECGFIYTNPCPSQDFMNLYYKSKHLYRLKTPDYDLGKRIKFLKRVKGKRNTLLEVGSSEGNFLKAVQKLGLNVFGMEPNENVNSISSKEEIKEKELIFDIIVANHVLEHIVDPLEFLKMLHSFLKEKGIIIVEVPNLHLYGMLCTGISYEHLVHFSPAHLGFLVQKAGFEIIEFEFGETSRLEGFIILAEKKKNLIPAKLTKEYEINQSYYLRAVKHIKKRNERYNNFIKELLPSTNSQLMVFWGANNILLDLLNKIPEKFLGQVLIVDGNNKRWDSKLNEKYPLVISNPESLKNNINISSISICAIDWHEEIKESIIHMGFNEKKIKIPPFF